MKRFKILDVVSEGSFGVVYKALNENGDPVAVKKMKHQFRNWQECVELREIKCLKKLSHPNVIKLREVIRENDELFLIFEFCERNLFQLMQSKETQRPFAEHHVRLIMYQLLSGLLHVHHQGFFHRDVKPENLLCSGLERVKLADFGLSRELDAHPLTDYISTRWYRAPEILLKSSLYGAPVDLWAAGAVMAELFLFRPLFPGTSEADELHKICLVLGSPSSETWPELFNGEVESSNSSFAANNSNSTAGGAGGGGTSSFAATAAAMVPLDIVAGSPLTDWVPMAGPEAIDLLSKLLVWNPAQRLTARQALQHPFFAVPPQGAKPQSAS
jgi:serine/threonine protein kinase